MKRILALVLSLLVLTCSTACLITPSATSVEYFNETASVHFETVDNWHLEKISSNKVTLGDGVPAGWSSWASVGTDNLTVYGDGSTSSVKVSCNYHVGWLDLPDLEKNTRYALAFNYKATGGYSGNKGSEYAFSTIGIYSKSVGGDVVDLSLSDTNFNPVNGFFVRKSSTAKSSYVSIDGTKENAVNKAGTSHINTKTDAWQTMEFIFNSGDINDFIMIFRFDSVTSVNFDNFSLTVLPLEESEEPENTYESHFENPENWSLDRAVKDSETGNQVATLGANLITWQVTADTSTAFVYGEQSKESFLVSNGYHVSSVTLPSGLEPNTNYTLSFWYYTDGNYSPAGKKYYAFESVGIYSPSVGGTKVNLTAYSYDGYLSRKCNDTTFGNYTALGGLAEKAVSVEANTFINTNEKQWQNMTLDFNSSNLNDLVLLFKTNLSAIYLDNFSIFKTPEPLRFHNGPDKEIKVDFEKEFEYFNGDQANRMEIAQTTDDKGNTTNAIHVFEGDYSYIDSGSVTILNHKAIQKGSDLVFCIPVHERTTYKMSVKVKVEEPKDVTADNLFLLYADYSVPIEFAHTYCNNLADGEWRTFETEFVTGYGQEHIKFFFNFGIRHPEIWIDDISLTAYSRGYIADTGLTYSENFFNLVEENEYKTSDTITEKTVMEIPVSDFELHTLGITLSGKGKVSLAFEKDGSDLIWSKEVTSKEIRYGENFMAGENEGEVFLIFEPLQGGITYKNAFIFRTKAVNFRTDMGYETLQNTVKDPSYTLKYVGADDLLGKDGFADYDGAEGNPATGDYASTAAALVVVLSLAVSLVALRPKKQR